MRIFLSFFVTFFLLSVGSFGQGAQLVPPATHHSILQEYIDQIQKISSELQKLQADGPKTMGASPTALSPLPNKFFARSIKDFFLSAMDYFEDVGTKFRDSVSDFCKMLSHLPRVLNYKALVSIGWFLWHLGFGVACGVLGYFLASKAFRRSFESLLERDYPQPPVVRVILFGTFFLTPLMILSFLQVGTFFLLESQPLQRGIVVSITSGTLLLGVVWKLAKILKTHPNFLSFAESSSNVGAFLIPPAFFWIKVGALSYVVGGWSLDLSYLLDLSDVGLRIILAFSRLGVAISAFGFLRIFRLFITRSLYQNRVFPYLRTVAHLWPKFSNFSITLWGILWVLEEDFLERIAGPLFFSLIMIPLMPVAYQLACRVRVIYLWRMRHTHSSLFFYQVLRSKWFINRIFLWGAYGGGVLSIAHLWDVSLVLFLQNVITPAFWDQLLEILILIGTAWILMYLGDKVLSYYLIEERYPSDSIEASRAISRWKTLRTILRVLLRIAIWVPTNFLCLSVLGISILPLLTSWGFMTAGIVFGAQSLVKDFITGFFIIFENSLVVGDCIRIDGKEGVIEDFHLRTIQVRMDDGTLLTIPFGSIGIIGNRSRHFAYVVLNVSVPYEEDTEKIQKLIEKSAQILKKTAGYSRKIIGPIEVRGVEDVTDSAIILQARLKTAPDFQDFVHRGLNGVLKKLFDEAGVRVPTPTAHSHGHVSLTRTTV